MIELHTWTTPNGRKISIALEEMQLDYRAHAVDITANEQFEPAFLAISPNNRIPAIRDGEITMFESGAILLYLARRSGRLLAEEGSAEHRETLEWLMWQMGGFGPMLGQVHHFGHYNPGRSEYAETRFRNEARRLYGVLDRRLEGRDHVVDALSIADIAIWPWASRFDYQGIDLNEFANVRRWYLALAARPAFQRGYAVPHDVGPIPLPG